MTAGRKKSAIEVMNGRMDENLLTLKDSMGNRSAEKGPKSS
jgi:hypothetical protein